MIKTTGRIVAFKHLTISYACPKYAFQVSCLFVSGILNGVVLILLDGLCVPIVYIQFSNYLSIKSKGSNYENFMLQWVSTCLTFTQCVLSSCSVHSISIKVLTFYMCQKKSTPPLLTNIVGLLYLMFSKAT